MDIKKRNLTLLASISISILIIIFKPLELNLNQSMILGTLVLTIIWWATGVVDKSIASIFLLLVFTLIGKTPLDEVYNFLRSDVFLMIIFSFLFSQGISNTNLADKLLKPFLFKYGNSFGKLMLTFFLLEIIMIFIIPQPFSRIIILALIINEFFKDINLHDKTRDAFMFWLHASSVFINMFLIRGDIILNNALINIADIPVTEFIWRKYMLVPSFIFYIIGLIAFKIVFKEEVKIYNKTEILDSEVKQSLTKKDKRNLALIIITVLFWALESAHGISGTIVVILGTFAMFLFKNINKEDLKSIDIKLLIFLTAAFSIGKVMMASGVSDKVFTQFINLLPKEFNNKYLLIVVMLSMALHMILGSNITTLSVVVPGMLTISQGLVDPIVMIFIIYITVCAHFILTFHNVIILIGNGNNAFSDKVIIKYAPILTVIVILSIFLVYKIWWGFIGVL